MAGDTLKFINYCKPKLEAGDYTFEVTQTYGDPDGATIALPPQILNVKVQGDRIRINPDQVFAKYPPAGEKGNFNDTIPHISLKKTTLPWERSAYNFDNDDLYGSRGTSQIHEPWFYLMLINEEDISRGDALVPKKVHITDLNKGAYIPQDFHQSLSNDIIFGTIGEEEEVQVVDLKKSFFKALIADRKEDLQYLAHVRQRYGIQEIQKDTAYSKDSLVIYKRSYYKAIRAIASATVSDLPTDDWEQINPLQVETTYSTDTVVVHQEKLYKAKKSVTTSITITESLSSPDWEEIKGGDLKRELSVIMSNRFPQGNPTKYPSGIVNHALLVSLEGYLNDDTAEDEETVYISESEPSGKDLDDLTEESFIRCVILTQWSFTSKMDNINFEERSKALDVGTLRLPSKDSSLKHPFIKNLPKRDGGTPFDDELAAGMSAILHQFRQGDRSLSWYRGPCVPSETTHYGTNQLSNYERGVEADETYIATDADRLLHYHKEQGMFDISYAAAYELGRFLAIRNEEYAKALYRYKKVKSRYVFLQKDDEDRSQDVIDKGITIKNLPYSKINEADLTEDRSLVRDYLEELGSLKEIPHWYVIPDPHLLPQRTIRTFQIDFKWIQSLWLGALSLGGRTEVSAELYEEMVTQLTPNIPHAGFFLRSDLVWAYPEMEVVAQADGVSLTVLRQEELTPEILMVLTDQDLNYISLELPPEALHYGLDIIKNPDANTDLFTTNKLHVAGKCFSVVWAQGTTITNGIPEITYTLPDGISPEIDTTNNRLSINLGVAGKATMVRQLKTALLADSNVQSVTTDSREEERLLDDSYQKTSVAYVISGYKFMLTSAIGYTLNPSSPIVSYDLGATPTVSIANGVLGIDLGSESFNSALEQLKIALEADPKIDSVDIGSTDQATLLTVADSSIDAYNSTSKVLNIGGVSVTLVLAEPAALSNHTLEVSYTLQSGAIPITTINSGVLYLQLGKSETPTSSRALKSMLEKQVEIQAVRTSTPDTAELFEVLNSYTQSSQELCIAGKKFILTMAEGYESTINNPSPIVTFDSPNEPALETSLSTGVLIIQLGAKETPTSLGKLKIALEQMSEITSVEITEDLNTPLLQEGYLKTEKEFVIAGRLFTLQLTEGQENLLDDVNPSVSYNESDGATPTIGISSSRLNIALGRKDSPTSVGQLKEQFLGQNFITAVTTNAADHETLILEAYMQNALHLAGKTLTLSYHKDLLDDHVPLVRDILADGSQPKVRVQDRTLIIDVGAKQSITNDNQLTTLAQLKTVLEAVDGIDQITISTGNTTDRISLYKRFTYEKSIKYAGSIVDSLDISDLVNNQGIVAVSELATEIKNKLDNGANVDQFYKDKIAESDFNFASAHLSRYLLEGEPKVEFSAGGTN
jgi:hypothetical protein